MSKNIVVLSDGTGQDGGSETNTNVYKLFNMAENRTPRQTCFYDPGVGSGRWGRLGGLAMGLGFGRNVMDCYRFIFEEFQAGDRIYLVGFSRGAATVRSLAYFIHLFGILPQGRDKLLRRAWSIYTISDPVRRKKEAERFIEMNHTMWTKVHFLGCYDTVAALGAPVDWASRAIDRVPWFKHRFHDLRLSPSVVHAYHALALDDQRTTFHPLLWEPLEDEPKRLAQGREPLACETLRQVWFAGMHTDVGGGYPSQELSDIPLVWLTQMATDKGLLVYPGHHVRITENADGRMHDSRAGMFRKLYRRKPRTWDQTRSDRPVVHASVLARKKNTRNLDEPLYACWLREPGPEVEPWTKYADQRWRRAGVRVGRVVGREP